MNQSAVKQSFYTRYFFILMAIFFIVIAVVGFGQSERMIQQQHIPIHWIVHVHGAILASWLLVFTLQTILVKKQHFRLHKKLGLLSVLLAVLVWLSMGIVIIHAHIGYPFWPKMNTSWATVFFLSSTMNLFGFFFTWGIITRKNAASHKRLLLLATLVLISAGLGRVLGFAGVDFTIQWPHLAILSKPSLSGVPNPSGLLFYNDLLLLLLFIYDYTAIKRLHRTTLLGSGIIIAVHLIILSSWRFLN